MHERSRPPISLYFLLILLCSFSIVCSDSPIELLRSLVEEPGSETAPEAVPVPESPAEQPLTAPPDEVDQGVSIPSETPAEATTPGEEAVEEIDMAPASSNKIPNVATGSLETQGSLDRDVIRRVVRTHQNEIRFCYEQGLQKNPKLAGTVKIKLVIAGTGSVMSVAVASSTLDDASVEQCIASKVKRWTFPEPEGGGIVVVTYPFTFSS